MLRRIWFIALMLALPPMSRAAEHPLNDFVAAEDSDYRVLQDMRSRFGGVDLSSAGSSRGEMMLALVGLGTDAAAQAPSGAWKTADYDALYSLLQKYRDELRGMGFQQKQLEDELAALKVRSAELQSRLDKLQPKDGMKIHGSILQTFDEMMLTGPGQNKGDSLRYREGLARAILDLSVTRGIVSGNVEYYMMSEVSNIFDPCDTCIAGVRSINVEIRTPLVFQGGDIFAKLSPLTLWRNEDEQPFEPEPFKSRRQALRDQLRLKPDALTLRGVRISTDLLFFEAQKLKLEGMIFSLGMPGQTVYTRGTTATLTGDTPAGESFKMVYSTYFGAWRATLPIKWLTLAYNGTIIRDAPDTAIVTWTASTPVVGGQRVKAFDSQVHSAEAEVKFDDEGSNFHAEYAASQYSNPNLGPNYISDYLTGTAMTGSIEFRRPYLGAKASVRDVSDTFISSPAQGRTQDAEFLPLGPFITENSLYNPNPTGVGPQYGGFLIPEPPESHFNTQIVPPQVIDASGKYIPGYFIPFDYRINAISPYGLATPNRSGTRLDLDGTLFGGGLKLMATADMAGEKVRPKGVNPNAYLAYRGGLNLDLDPLLGWPVSFNGGYTVNDMRDGGKVAFTSTLADIGAVWKANKNMSVFLGGRHIDYNGTLVYTGTDVTLAAFGYVSYKQAYDIGAIGMNWMLGDDVNLRMNYASMYFEDPRDRATNKGSWWAADQGYVEISIVF